MKHACVHFFTSPAKYWTIQNTSNSIQFQNVFWCLCTLSGVNHWRVANLRYWGQSQSWTQMSYSVLCIGRHCLFFVWRLMVYSNSQLEWKKDMSSLPENHPWMILLRPAHCLLEFNILARHWKVPQNSILVAYRTNHALDSQIAEHLPKYSSTPSTVLSGQNVYV